MSLHDEKFAALTEIIAATGEPVLWKGRTFQALVTDNPLDQTLVLGGFEAKACEATDDSGHFAAQETAPDSPVASRASTPRWSPCG